jgi:hypothetical protein
VLSRRRYQHMEASIAIVQLLGRSLLARHMVDSARAADQAAQAVQRAVRDRLAREQWRGLLENVGQRAR